MKKLLLFTLLLTLSASLSAQRRSQEPTVSVDRNGIMRWSDTNQEASFYGVNYTVPFSHAYRALERLGVDRKKTIDKDTYHFSRLGFNAYRIHIWDAEISDREGNLAHNDHLDLFDYLLARLKERGISIVLTLMTHGGNGYPDGGTTLEGFSAHTARGTVYSDPNSVNMQIKYVTQLLNHINPYTGIAYNNEPAIVGYEIDNEPRHPGSKEDLKRYINTMIDAMKKAGNTKPVFYNVTHNLHLVEGYYETPIQGTTYQWYPTGLVAGFTRQGNFLPNADEYFIEFKDRVKDFNRRAKLVYEFDAPDVAAAYLYPAIARTFRTQGIQWITMFAYDPIDMAWMNTEYQTHFMNLAYTPDKAISMKIAAEVRKQMPLGKHYEPYPKDTVFEAIHLSYLQNLSELNTKEKFFYSNSTSTRPVDAANLQEVAGRGSSPVVKYEGTGAYFLDRLEDGVWRLEVMPDALWVDEPFEKASPRREVATIMWNTWPIEIDLPALGQNFTFAGLNSGNSRRGAASGRTMNVSPGVYLLTKSGVSAQNNWNADSKWGVITLGEYVAPAAHANKYSVVHKPARFAVENAPLKIKADIIGPAMPDSVSVYMGRIHHRYPRSTRFVMDRTSGLSYETTIPADAVTGDIFSYTIVVYKNGEPQSFPADVDAHPLDWDYYWTEYYESPVVERNSPITLVAVNSENKDIEVRGIPDTYTSAASKMVARTSPGEATRLKVSFTEDKGTDARFFVRKFIKPDIDPRRDRLSQVSHICIILKNAEGVDRLNVGFLTNTGYTYTAPIRLSASETVYRIPVSQLSQVTTALLPETYPVFMKRYFVPETNIPFRLQDIEILEVSTDDVNGKNGSFELGAVWLE